MAAILSIPSLYNICRGNSARVSLSPSCSFSGSNSVSFSLPRERVVTNQLRISKRSNEQLRWKIVMAVSGETLAPQEDEEAATTQSVSVPVSPSDMLTMFFQAEGTLDETAIPNVTKALQEIEDISDLNVQVTESIASVKLTKQTTVQATGVASNLVEIIQGCGFKLQTLNLSFEDEEDTLN